MPDSAASEESNVTETEVKEESKAPPPKPRGRKPRNKPESTPIDLGKLPDEIVEVIALAPLIGVTSITKTATRIKDEKGNVIHEGVTLSFDPDAAKATVAAFKAWLATIDFELSPGWALLAMYLVTLGSAAPDAMAQIASAREEAQKELERRTNAAKSVNAPPNPNNGSGAINNSAS